MTNRPNPLARSRHRRIGIAVAAVTGLMVFSLPVVVFGWGAVGHRVSGEAAARRMPIAMPAFFRNAAKQLAYLNPGRIVGATASRARPTRRSMVAPTPNTS